MQRQPLTQTASVHPVSRILALQSWPSPSAYRWSLGGPRIGPILKGREKREEFIY